MIGMKWLALAAIAGVSACSEVDDLLETPYEQDQERLDDLRDEIRGRVVTDPSRLPTSGSVSYDGVLGFDTRLDGADRTVLGDLRMTADWDSDEVSGRADSFHADNFRRVGGELIIDNGRIDRTAAGTRRDPAIDGANVRGVLTSTRGTALQYRGTLDGNFYGPRWGYMGGSLDGVVDDGTDIEDADGSFAARR